MPVLLIASDTEPYDQARGAHVRADGIITKPFEARELISLVLKFAGRFEAETIRLPVSPIVPPQPQERTQEFTAFREAPDDEPTIMHHSEPDFSAQAEGVAFTQSSVEGAQEPSPESYPHRTGMPFPKLPDTAPTFAESAFESASGFDEAQPATAEATPAANSFSPQPSPSPAFDLSPPTEPRGATQEPIFIEEQQAPASHPHHHGDSGAHTMIFRSPLAIAEPDWKDETVLAAPVSASAGPSAPEPQLEAEIPPASAETPAELAFESTVPPVTATSLGSFSLDDAAAGQVHFPSLDADLVPFEHTYFASADEVTAVGDALLVRTESDSRQTTLEPVQAAAAQPEAPAATVYAESVPCDSRPEAGPPAGTSDKAAAKTVNTAAAASESELKPSPPESSRETTAPPSAFDWNLFYLVVHKAVVKMSPPIFPADLVEEISKRIADEIAIEITSGSPHSQA